MCSNCLRSILVNINLKAKLKNGSFPLLRADNFGFNVCLLWARRECGEGFVKRGLAPLLTTLLTRQDGGIHGDGQMRSHRLGHCPRNDIRSVTNN